MAWMATQKSKQNTQIQKKEEQLKIVGTISIGPPLQHTPYAMPNQVKPPPPLKHRFYNVHE